MKSKEIIDCYLACREGRDGSKFITRDASKDPIEYFAESVRAYLNQSDRGENISRVDLLQNDPAMINIISQLFREISRFV